MANIEFKKRPTPKHLANRRVSFAAVGEVEHVRSSDDISLVVATKTGSVHVTMTGAEFLGKLQQRSTKDGTKIFILEF